MSTVKTIKKELTKIFSNVQKQVQTEVNNLLASFDSKPAPKAKKKSAKSKASKSKKAPAKKRGKK